MALPSNIGYGTVVGRFLLAYADSSDVDLYPDGIPAKGSVFFTPSPANLKDVTASPAPVTILPSRVEAVLDADGYLCGYTGNQGIRLVATDDTDLNPLNWTWLAEFRLTDENDASVTLSSFSFSLPAGTSIDLAAVAPVPDANGTYYLVGPAGPANALTVSGTTTGAAGSSASVSISGTSPTQSLAFTIPRGDQGVQGTQGIQGIQGIQGPQPWTFVGAYDNGLDYDLGDAVTYAGGFYYRTGNPNNPGYPPIPGSITASWTPVADKGATGSTGATGPANELTVGTVTTGAPEDPAEVTITGTAPDQTISFVIPQGEQGIQGIQGPAGDIESLSATLPVTYAAGVIGFDPTYISSIDGGSA
jgi:hypothetical protein